MTQSIHSFVNGKADGGDATVTRPSDWNAVHKAIMQVSAQSGASVTLADSDNGKIIDLTGSSAQTVNLPDASTLIADWCVYIRNSNTGVGDAGEAIIDPNGTQTVDGLGAGNPIYSWPGSIHLLRRASSTSWTSIIIRGGFVEVQDTAGDTLHWPANAVKVDIELLGAGGGGSSGQKGASGTARFGGGGGGGGARFFASFAGNALTASTALTCTCGTGGTGATTNTGTSTLTGSDGTNSTVSASGLPTLYGFGGSKGTNAPYGGGGASMLGSVANQVYGAPGGNNNAGYSSGTQFRGSAGGGTGQVFNSNEAESTVWGGAGGGGEPNGAPSAASGPGGRSVFGGAGGGGGGSISSGGTAYAGGDGGGTGQSSSYDNNGGGGAAGATGANGTAGTAGPTVLGPGTGGGGGGASSAASGGNGANGGIACGGGGGGSTNTGAVAGGGGNGGNGLIRMSYR